LIFFPAFVLKAGLAPGFNPPGHAAALFAAD
jgi:hypothetical protein